MSADPLGWWQQHFAGLAPSGPQLRAALADRWVRFHSLPDSKRYADSDDDAAEIQRRHLAVASALFTPGEILYVFRARPGERRLRGRARHQLAGRQFREDVVVLPATASAADDEDRLYVRALVTTWKPDFFEAAIDQLAAWEEVGISFVSPQTGNILCPYDGGMDVFTVSIAPQALRARFTHWLPKRPSSQGRIC